MSTVARQLEQLNKEFAAKCLEVDAAFEAYNVAAAATTRAAIALAGAPSDKRLQVLHDGAQEEEDRALGRYEDLKKNEERLREVVRALHAKPSALTFSHVSSTRHSENCALVRG